MGRGLLAEFGFQMDGKLLKGVILKQVLIIAKSFKHLAVVWRVGGACREVADARV